jgi:AcrR family transcriptional regulator
MNKPTETLDAQAAWKAPQQGRSKASYERMLNAAEALLVDTGGDAFSLTDVSRVGRVSIGSIYHRFNSKDELIHAVHARFMDRLSYEQTRIVMLARSRSKTPSGLVRAIIEELAEFLKNHAATMRPIMLRAAHDRVVQDRGRVAHEEMVDSVVEELIGHRSDIRHQDPERAIRAMLGIAYAAIARELGFGMAEAPQGAADWEEMKSDLGEMAARFLLIPSVADAV